MGVKPIHELRPRALVELQNGNLTVDEFNEVIAFADLADKDRSGIIEEPEYLKNRHLLTMDGSKRLVGGLFIKRPLGTRETATGQHTVIWDTRNSVEVSHDVNGQPLPDSQRGALAYLSYRIVAGEDALLYHLVNNQSRESLSVGDRVGIDFDGDGKVDESGGDVWITADDGFITQFKLLKGEEADKIFNPDTVTPRSTGRNLRPTE